MSNRVLFLADLHIPYSDEAALDMALNYAAKHTFDTVVMTELPDFYSVSSWCRDPQRVSLLADELHDCVKVVEKVSSLFKGRDKIYIPGNHDNRLERYIWKHAPALAGLSSLDMAMLLGLTENGWIYYDNKKALMEGRKPFHIGHLTFLHGHEVRMGWGAVNVAKILYERCRTNVIAGHFHRHQEWIVRTLAGDHEGAFLVGCLSDLNPEFQPHNDWVHGFGDIQFDDDGDFEIRNRKIMRRKIL